MWISTADKPCMRNSQKSEYNRGTKELLTQIYSIIQLFICSVTPPLFQYILTLEFLRQRTFWAQQSNNGVVHRDASESSPRAVLATHSPFPRFFQTAKTQSTHQSSHWNPFLTSDLSANLKMHSESYHWGLYVWSYDSFGVTLQI